MRRSNGRVPVDINGTGAINPNPTTMIALESLMPRPQSLHPLNYGLLSSEINSISLRASVATSVLSLDQSIHPRPKHRKDWWVSCERGLGCWSYDMTAYLHAAYIYVMGWARGGRKKVKVILRDLYVLLKHFQWEIGRLHRPNRTRGKNAEYTMMIGIFRVRGSWCRGWTTDNWVVIVIWYRDNCIHYIIYGCKFMLF